MEAEGEQPLQNHDEEELTRHEKHRNSQQTEAEVGIIEMIKLENFMCHRHLELKLGPNINFIIGQNGSTFNPTTGFFHLTVNLIANFTVSCSSCFDLTIDPSLNPRR